MSFSQIDRIAEKHGKQRNGKQQLSTEKLYIKAENLARKPEQLYIKRYAKERNTNNRRRH
jgi:hypothetical protein